MNQIVISEQIESSYIYISKSGDGNFSNIQDGIDAANTGDTIYVYNGTYFENIVIDKLIILTGENKNSTIIDGRNTGNVIKINANNVTIQGFKIQHSGLIYPNSGINLSSNDNRILDNLIMNNYYGMTLYNSSGNIIQSNTIQNDDHCGIYLSTSLKNFIVNNTIKFHNYNGIGLYYSSDKNTIETNNLNNNGFCGVNIRTSIGNNVIGNTITNNSIGVHLPSQNNENNNSFLDNDINVEREFKLYDYGIFIIVGFYGLTSIVIIIIYEKMQRKKRK
jgi:parallel beta-helix repeat protein